jgi:hypothetical protein
MKKALPTLEALYESPEVTYSSHTCVIWRPRHLSLLALLGLLLLSLSTEAGCSGPP